MNSNMDTIMFYADDEGKKKQTASHYTATNAVLCVLPLERAYLYKTQ